MNKNILYLLLLSMNLFSCTLIKIVDDVHTISSRDKEDDIRGNIHVYIENKTNEIILVNIVYLDIDGKKTGKSMELARVSKSEIKMINISKGRRVSVTGGNTRKEYFETICENDYETFVIY